MIIFEYPSLRPQISFLLFYLFLGSSHYRDWLGSLPSESAFHPICTASRSPPLFLLLNLLKVCFLTFQTPPQVPQTQFLLLNQHKWLSWSQGCPWLFRGSFKTSPIQPLCGESLAFSLVSPAIPLQDALCSTISPRPGSLPSRLWSPSISQQLPASISSPAFFW